MLIVVSFALTILGILIMWKLSRKVRGWLTILVDIIGIILVVFGMYSLWRQDPLSILGVVVFVGALSMYSYYQNRPEVKAKKILNIYKQVKENQADTNKRKIYRETAKRYYQRYTNWSDIKISLTAKNLVGLEENDIEEPENIEEFVDRILLFEKSSPSDVAP